MQSVIVYDIAGRLLGSYKDLNNNELFIRNIQKNNAPLLLKITLKNGIVVDKKVIY
jgi:hypothetical protein